MSAARYSLLRLQEGPPHTKNWRYAQCCLTLLLLMYSCELCGEHRYSIFMKNHAWKTAHTLVTILLQRTERGEGEVMHNVSGCCDGHDVLCCLLCCCSCVNYSKWQPLGMSAIPNSRLQKFNIKLVTSSVL